MTLRTRAGTITGDLTPHTARQHADGSWTVTWLPNRPEWRFAEDDAAVAMMIAENAEVATRVALTPEAFRQVQVWARRLGLSREEALRLAAP